MADRSELIDSICRFVESLCRSHRPGTHVIISLQTLMVTVDESRYPAKASFTKYPVRDLDIFVRHAECNGLPVKVTRG